MTPDDPRIEKVARALCKHAGKDPNEPASGMGDVVLNFAPYNTNAKPRWHDYADKAQEFVVMYDAIRPE